MTDFQIKRLSYNLTAQAGLSLVGQYLKRFAQIDQIIDPRFSISGQGGIATSTACSRPMSVCCASRQMVILWTIKEDFEKFPAHFPDL